MPTPNHPKLPLCCALAADPARYLFSSQIGYLLESPTSGTTDNDRSALSGMLSAYLEAKIITADQYSAMWHELRAFVRDATA